MKCYRKRLWSWMVFALLSACAHSTITPFSRPPAGHYPPTDPATVGVYRSDHPLTSFKEIGLISNQSQTLNLPQLYQTIREDAAHYGADDVIDVKIRGDQHWENQYVTDCVPVTKCSPDGACTTENICQPRYIMVNVMNFLIEGSMIRRQP